MENNSISVLHQIALTFLTAVGSVTARSLLTYFKTPEKVFEAPLSKLTKVEGVGTKVAQAIIDSKKNALERAEIELQFIEKEQITPIFIHNPNYPFRLKNCSDAPIMLYYKGANIDFNHPKIISIIGTRNISEYGKEQCAQLIASLAPYNPLIISGLAFGVDIHAHKISLQHNLSTVGVLGHGLDKLYPLAHKSIALKMQQQNGGLLAEFPSQTQFVPENFPKRNRIVAGISDATIIIETALKGGSMITAQIAHSYNKEVYALPGRINDLNSMGCNYLIKRNIAALIENAQDVAYNLGWDTPASNNTATTLSLPFAKENNNTAAKAPKKTNAERLMHEQALTNEQNDLINLFLKNTQSPYLHLDSICSKLPQYTQSCIAAALLTLEFEGAVKMLPGNLYYLI